MDKLLALNQDEFGVTAHKGRPVVSSRYVAQVFGKEHFNVLRDIENLQCSPEFVNLNFELTSYKDRLGRKYPEYRLTRDGFTILAMGFTGKKAMQFKIAYINRFNEMEASLAELATVRLEFPDFTDAILSAHEEPRPYHFSNEIDMINRIVLGMTAKEFKAEHGIPESVHSIRPYLTQAQIKTIERLQRFDTGLVFTEPDYQKRKQILTDYHNRITGIKLLRD